MKTIDLSKLSKPELRNLLGNARRLGHQDVADEVVRAMAARGWAERRDYDLLEWSQSRVKDVMAPFAAIARGVRGNQRTSYTEAGGMKIGRAADDPDRMWIDTYSAIKTERINAVLVCYVRKPGETPRFELQVGSPPRTRTRYPADELERALQDWRAIAAGA